MADRRELEEKLNRLNQLYQQKDLEMRKLNATPEDIDSARQKMRDMLNTKKSKVMAEMGDDLQKLNAGEGIGMKGATVSEAFDQSKLPDAAEQKLLGKQGMFKNLAKQLGKKAAGVIPLAGVGMAALSGDPAMAAEELTEDAMGPLGALKPDVAGNPEDDAMMRAESKAFSNYLKSPASRDREARLDEIISGKPRAQTNQATEIAEEDDLIDEAGNERKKHFSKLRDFLK